MLDLFSRARGVYKDEGLYQLLIKGVKFGYDTYIRPHLPLRKVSYNGVPVQVARLGDSIIPWHETDIPGYEQALVKGIREHVEEGDKIVIVGGGWGVSTVVAARHAGYHGCVTTFEGSLSAAKNVQNTVEVNSVTNRVTVKHAVVGQAISLHGTTSEDESVSNELPTISPTKLPQCDVLVLDCEGAELDILSRMEIDPRTIIVETHGIYGAPESEVRSCLQENGYDVIDKSIAEERLKMLCKENGIFVLTAPAV